MKYLATLFLVTGLACSIKFFVIGYDKMTISDAYFGIVAWVLGVGFAILSRLPHEP